MKKICHMTSAHPQEDVRIFHKECTSLAQEGYDVYLVSPGKTYDKGNVHIIGVESHSGGRLHRALITAGRVYKKAVELDADIYHFHDPELLPYGLMLKCKGKTVVFDSHENTREQILEKTWINAKLLNIVYHTFGWYQRNACKAFDSVVTVTPNVYEYFHSFQPHTVMVTNYPIYHPIEKTPAYDSRTIGFAGGISELWNHHNIISALDAIDGVRYILCGRCEPEYLAKLMALPSWDKVDFRGMIPFSSVPAAMAECSIGIALANYNRNAGYKLGNLGNTKIFEQMMAGLPVICTDFVLWKQIIDEYQCGICIEPNNVESIISAVTELINDPEKAEKMGMNGHRAVREKYNWESQKGILLELYSRLERSSSTPSLRIRLLSLVSRLAISLGRSCLCVRESLFRK